MLLSLLLGEGAPAPAEQARFRFKLACAHFHDACRHLAHLIAHPELAKAIWRVRLIDGVAYWWRARIHLHDVVASQTRWLHQTVASCLRRAGTPPVRST
jgi:hypothetical protein